MSNYTIGKFLYVERSHSGLPSGHLEFYRLPQMTLRLKNLKSSVSVVSENGLICILTPIIYQDMPV